MNASQVLDMQADLLDRAKPQGGVMFKIIEHQLDISYRDISKKSAELGHQGALSVPHFLETAYAYRVTPDMCTMVAHAANELYHLDRFDRNMAPTGAGFVHFERALEIHDIRGQKMLAHWMLWGPAMRATNDLDDDPTPGLLVHFFNDVRLEPDEISIRIERDHLENSLKLALGRWRYIGSQTCYQAQRMGPVTRPNSTEEAQRLIEQGDIPHESTNLLRAVQALFMLLNQQITSVIEEDVDRATRKRMGRMGLPKRVTVIALRRTSSGHAEGESMVEWSHRWLVRGHWRWQPYGRHIGEGEHGFDEVTWDNGWSEQRCVVPGCEAALRRIFIPPHVKGPAGKPLIVSRKVYDLRR